jgi:ketosteroid isomerase-like protein
MPRMSARAIAVFLALIAVLWVVMPRLRPATDEAEAVRETETKLDQASAQGDIQALDGMIGPDFSSVNGNGNREDRSEFLDRLRTNPWRIESLHPTGIEIRIYGDVAVVTGADEVRSRDSAGLQSDTAYRFLHVFQKRDGHWLLIAGLGSNPGLP